MILFSLRDNCNYISSDVHFKNVDVRISQRNDDTGIHVTELEQGSSSGPFSCDRTKWTHSRHGTLLRALSVVLFIPGTLL